MRENPILFNGEMVRAILDGRKTQTRRAVGRVSADCELFVSAGGEHWQQCFRDDHGRVCGKSWLTRCPYGQPGDRLWVRETWNADWCDHVIYRADGGSAVAAGYSEEPRWRPSIHMPRWACRILLDVVSVRVERLQDISRADAIAEGAPGRFHAGVDREFGAAISIAWFAKLWDSTYAKRGLGWDANPWVWVIEFTRAEATA